ncbi:efflux RND transporter permease subunit [Pseudovibrio exalbescens]|uniref:efflux RND transporter permease subunit n=1 Tax=Pseudovibrio exalbescens TaxID=197461 RepID=UPI0023671356|nr:efflux RND transporter permease subunit [Pseudovibrio exalbescens]MDD7911160.1 efflux RND transporter permease subunit [Pseudovibrio exalbescens]
MLQARESTVSLIGAFVRHRNAANLLMTVLVLFGVFALVKLNTQFFPTITTSSITVSISWPGSSAEDVEANILAAVEPELRFLDSLDEVTSYAREGGGTISLDFIEGTDMQKALSDVEQAVSSITTLPDDADTPEVSFAAYYDNVARIALRGPFTEQALKIFAKDIRDDLIARGIDKVTITGMRDEEYLVEVPEENLRRLNLTVADIASRIEENSEDIPAGNLTGAVERQVRAVADTSDPMDIAKIAVKTFPSGEKVRLADIGSVERNLDDDDVLGLSRKDPAIELRIQRAENSDTLEASAIVKGYLEEIRPQLPQSLELVMYNVSADRVEGRIMLLVKNGLGGLLIVIAVLFLFLNARVAFWVAAGIPVAIMATLGIMWGLGQSINMISCFALIMMLGVIVDDAIVVGEHTATLSSRGEPPITAAILGANTMFWPIIAAGTTTIAAFGPILMLGDTMGQIMGVLPVVVIAVVIASLLECFFVLPGHLAHSLNSKPGWSWWRVIFVGAVPAVFLLTIAVADPASIAPWLKPLAASIGGLKQTFGFTFELALMVALFGLALALETLLMIIRQRKERMGLDHNDRGGFREAFDRGFAWFRDKPVQSFLRATFKYRYITVAVAISTLILSVGMMQGGRVGFTFFPSPESENIRASITFHSGISEQKARENIGLIEDALYEVASDLSGGDPNSLIEATFTTLGQSGNNRGDNVARLNVQLTSSEVRDVRTPTIVTAWRKAIPQKPELSRIAIQQTRGGPPGKDLDIRLTGTSLANLKEAADILQVALSGFPGVTGVEDDLPYGKPELVLALTDRGRALGFTVESAARQVRYAIEGAIPRRFAEGDEEITVKVRQTNNGEGLAGLRDLYLRSPDGEFVPMTEVVSLRDKQGYSLILRRDGKITVSVVADVDPDVTSRAEISSKLEESTLPNLQDLYNIDYTFDGRAKEQSAAFSDLMLGAVLAVAIIYLILAAVFASYTRPLAVMSIIPFGIVGAIVGHYLLGFKLTILSIIGLLGMAGILVNNSIILVARFEDRLSLGNSLEDAAVGASMDRLRAIILTSCTTIGGLSPLLFETSVQAQFLMPMAITVVFGLAASTLLVLVIVPALIGIGNDVSSFLSLRGGQGSDGHVEPAE